MRRRHVVAFAVGLMAAVTVSFAQPPQTFTAPLTWVPISGAERNDVAGSGSATATLSRSQFAGQRLLRRPARRRDAREPPSRRRDGRARPRLPDRRAPRSPRMPDGTFNGAIRARPRDQRAALLAGHLYIQLHSGTRRRTRTGPRFGVGCSRTSAQPRIVVSRAESHATTNSKSPRPMRLISRSLWLPAGALVAATRARGACLHRGASRGRPLGLRAELRHVPRPCAAPVAECVARRRRSSWHAGATARRAISSAKHARRCRRKSRRPAAGGVREHRRVHAAIERRRAERRRG